MDRLQKIVRVKDSRKYTGYGPTQTAELIKKGLLPKPFALSSGGRAKAWTEQQLLDHQKKLLEAAGVSTESNREAGNS